MSDRSYKSKDVVRANIRRSDRELKDRCHRENRRKEESIFPKSRK